MKRFFRQCWQFWERTPPFIVVFFSRRGIFDHEGRILIWGKLRRFTLSAYPPLAQYLSKKYGIQGGCTGCGASCNLMFPCPQFDTATRRCTIYEDRPNICRTFPITPADIRDRNISRRDQPCGFTFRATGAKR